MPGRVDEDGITDLAGLDAELAELEGAMKQERRGGWFSSTDRSQESYAREEHKKKRKLKKEKLLKLLEKKKHAPESEFMLHLDEETEMMLEEQERIEEMRSQYVKQKAETDPQKKWELESQKTLKCTLRRKLVEGVPEDGDQVMNIVLEGPGEQRSKAEVAVNEFRGRNRLIRHFQILGVQHDVPPPAGRILVHSCVTHMFEV